MVQTGQPSYQEALEAGGLKIGGWIQCEFKADLGNVLRPFQKIKRDRHTVQLESS